MHRKTGRVSSHFQKQDKTNRYKDANASSCILGTALCRNKTHLNSLLERRIVAATNLAEEACAWPAGLKGGVTAFIGIDWADTKHDVCLKASNNDKREFAVIPHQVDRIEQWAHAVHERFGGTIAIALELAKGPIVYALQKYDFLGYSSQPVDAGEITRNFYAVPGTI